MYSTEDTEITLAPNCEDVQAWKPNETQRMINLHYQSYQMLRAQGVHICTTAKEGK